MYPNPFNNQSNVSQVNRLDIHLRATKIEYGTLMIQANAHSERGIEPGIILCKWNPIDNNLEMTRDTNTKWLLSNNVCEAIATHLFSQIKNPFILRNIVQNGMFNVSNVSVKNGATHRFTHDIKDIHVHNNSSRFHIMVERYFDTMAKPLLHAPIVRTHY